MSQYKIFYYINNVLHKTKSKTLKDIAAEWLHNSTGNRPGVIAHLELPIEESQIFFSFWAAGLSSMKKIASLSTLMVGSQQVVGKIWYAGHNMKGKAITGLYAEKYLHIDSLILKHPIYYVISTIYMTKLTSCQDHWLLHLFIYRLTTQSKLPTVISHPDITNPNRLKSH
jgi:hypothetical protein